MGLAVSAGFAAVFTVAGLLVAAGLRSLVGAMPWVAAATRWGPRAAGSGQFTGRHVGVRVGTGWLSRSGTGVGRMAALGAALAFSSLSCTLAVLLAEVAQALATATLVGPSPSSSPTVRLPGPCSSRWPSRPRS